MNLKKYKSKKILQFKILKKIKKSLNTSTKIYLNLKTLKNKNHISSLQISILNKKNKKINFFTKSPLFFKSLLKININKNGQLNKLKNSDQLMEVLGLIKTIKKEVNSFFKAFKWKNKTNKFFKTKEV